MTDDELIERLALVSHLTWERHRKEDGLPSDEIPREITEHDVERAEDALAALKPEEAFNDIVNVLAETSRASYIKQARRRQLATAAIGQRMIDEAQAAIQALEAEPDPKSVKQNRERAADFANELKRLGIIGSGT